ncbi:potassium channel family protein [Enterococcus dongliensis]|uniref:potassium channel family protein n=1 Tax=Enterococcus dongliensis TaxID=2559925 RepID=UPI002891C193|nr:potassium channel family protein [Enterococcus dongliensis]MDT2614105.1 potassium channel family protein [Enterococcus dongliensis]MDT2638717.1 potassium channel family protein [Enterococcus dongliensis]MDT2669626.1 potassium channel family protein [Enterococcus dongliensis]MDT2674626.1 potassium channel family protein [Enterococcus dongliensis]MDT2703602.1 potassium channel family protein [Enterococcus dongliensis]
MVAFFVVFRSLWRVLRILFRQPEQKAVMLAVLVVLMIGTFFYHNIEGMTYLDGLYFSVMTLATVGYGDLAPQTAVGKLFTIGYVLIGVGILTAMIANFNRALVEYHQKKRNEKES